jgi:hypothetical protein
MRLGENDYQAVVEMTDAVMVRFGQLTSWLTASRRRQLPARVLLS